MVVVPAVLPNTPPIKRNPVFLYYEDRFQKPTPFHPDIVVDISSVWDKKVDDMDAHESQFYEFQTNVNASIEVPTDKAERKSGSRSVVHLRQRRQFARPCRSGMDPP